MPLRRFILLVVFAMSALRLAAAPKDAAYLVLEDDAVLVPDWEARWTAMAPTVPAPANKVRRDNFGVD